MFASPPAQHLMSNSGDTCLRLFGKLLVKMDKDALRSQETWLILELSKQNKSVASHERPHEYLGDNTVESYYHDTLLHVRNAGAAPNCRGLSLRLFVLPRNKTENLIFLSKIEELSTKIKHVTKR